jgi:hypothetical protein
MQEWCRGLLFAYEFIHPLEDVKRYWAYEYDRSKNQTSNDMLLTRPCE